MKANLLTLTLMTMATLSAYAGEKLYVEGGYNNYTSYAKVGEASTESEKDMKIANLNKLLDQQQRLYEEKINYLEDELKKSKERLVEKSINYDSKEELMEKKFAEESSYLKKELVAKTKTLMEYQRQLEKIKPSEDMKNLIKVNTELAIQLRSTTDQIANLHMQAGEAFAAKKEAPAAGARMPASVGK